MDFNSIPLLFFVLTFAATIIPNLNANYVEFDEFLEKRAEKALVASFMAYNPNPEEVTNNFNKQVEEALQGENSTRRHLIKVAGDHCQAANPIDKCWRCDPNWANNRKKLADCARGFGFETTGGKDGEFYIVTDPSDDDVVEPKPGTFRHAVIQEEPLWIIFDKSMVITLKKELVITDDKTIDGRGVNVRIAYGAGLTIQFVENVIIHNILIHDIVSTSGGKIRDSFSHIGVRGQTDGDGIKIFGASHVWIDHVTLANATDGLVDAVMASTAITISNCKFNHHNSVMLLGADDDYGEDSIMQVTVAFNRFGRRLVQRMPRCRYGFFHIVNNDYRQWKMYAIGGSANPTIVSQGNRFKPTNNPSTKQVTKRELANESVWMEWQWRSEGDLFLNGAYFVESGTPLETSPLLNEKNIKHKHGSYVGSLTRHAGALRCEAGSPC